MAVLDIFRLWGAITVFFVHASTTFGSTALLSTQGPPWLSWFFMLSGFVLWLRYHDVVWHRPSLKSYIKARFLRLAPAYFVAILFSFAVVYLGYQWFGPQFFTVNSGRINVYLVGIPDVMTLQCWLYSLGIHLSFVQTLTPRCGGLFLLNPPAWSVSTEFLIYLVFPLVMVAVRRIEKISWLTLLLALLIPASAILAWLVTNDATKNSWPDLIWSVHVNPLTRGGEFLIGMVLAHIWTSQANWRQAHKDWYWLGIVAALAIYGYLTFDVYTTEDRFRLSAMGLPWMLIALLAMIHLSVRLNMTRNTFSNWCAGVSYCLYCIHWPVIELFHTVGWTQALTPRFGPTPALLLCLALTLCLAHALNRFTEYVVARMYRK